MPGQEFYTTPCCLLCPCKSCKNVCAGGQRARKERKRELVGAPRRKGTKAAKSSTRHLLPVASMQILNPVCLKLSDQSKMNQRTSVHSLEAAQQRALHRVWSALPVPSMQILHQWLVGCIRPSLARGASVDRGRGLQLSIAGLGCSIAVADCSCPEHCRVGMQPRVRAAATPAPASCASPWCRICMG